MMILLFATISEQLFRGTIVGTQFIKTMIDREHAEMLALSGIKIAMVQLKQFRDPILKTGETENEELNIRSFIHFLIAFCSHWETFTLGEKELNVPQDTVPKDCYVKICITCEEGKVNINKAFDFVKGDFKAQYQPLIKELLKSDDEVEKASAAKGAGSGPVAEPADYKEIKDFLKRRYDDQSGEKLYDLSQLISVLKQTKIPLFYNPPELTPKDTDKAQLTPKDTNKAQGFGNYALSDIFTIWTNDGTEDGSVDPILLSDGIRQKLGLRRPSSWDSSFYQKDLITFATSFDPGWAIIDDKKNPKKPYKYEELKNILNLLYAKKTQKNDPIPGLSKDQILDSVYADGKIMPQKLYPQTYSVISHGKYNRVTQKLLAIIKEVEESLPPGTTAPAGQVASTAQKKPKKYFKILRLYWL
jgi:hypothetical protein